MVVDTNARIPIGGGTTIPLTTKISSAKLYRKGCTWNATTKAPPFRYTPSYLVAQPQQSFNLTGEADGSIDVSHRGGGGDYTGNYSCSFSYTFPDIVKKYLSYDGINATLAVMVGTSHEIDTGKAFNITVDWNSWLDKVVVLAVNNIIAEGNVRVYVFNVWGVLRTSLPVVSTILNVSYGWITNDHESNYANFRVQVRISSSVSAIRDNLSLPASELGFEIINADAMQPTDDESD